MSAEDEKSALRFAIDECRKNDCNHDYYLTRVSERAAAIIDRNETLEARVEALLDALAGNKS